MFNYYRSIKLKRDGKLDEIDEEDALEWEETTHHEEVNEIDIQKVGLILLFENYSYLELFWSKFIEKQSY